MFIFIIPFVYILPNIGQIQTLIKHFISADFIIYVRWYKNTFANFGVVSSLKNKNKFHIHTISLILSSFMACTFAWPLFFRCFTVGSPKKLAFAANIPDEEEFHAVGMETFETVLHFLISWQCLIYVVTHFRNEGILDTYVTDLFLILESETNPKFSKNTFKLPLYLCGSLRFYSGFVRTSRLFEIKLTKY